MIRLSQENKKIVTLQPAESRVLRIERAYNLKIRSMNYFLIAQSCILLFKAQTGRVYECFITLLCVGWCRDFRLFLSAAIARFLCLFISILRGMVLLNFLVSE